MQFFKTTVNLKFEKQPTLNSQEHGPQKEAYTKVLP